jgi:hypothetical protein
MTIAACHIPDAVHPFKVPVPIEGLLFPLIKNPGVVDSIHQRAVLFLEKRNIKVGVKTKHNSMSMEEFPEITKEPMGGESAKRNKGSGEDIPANRQVQPQPETPDMLDEASIPLCSLYPSATVADGFSC